MGISGESLRESDPGPDQTTGRGRETGSLEVLTLTHQRTVLLKALKGCLDHSYPCTTRKTFEPFHCPKPVNRAELEWIRVGAKKPVGGWFSNCLRGNKGEYCVVRHLLHLSLLFNS